MGLFTLHNDHARLQLSKEFIKDATPKWGPIGKDIHNSRYSRNKEDGSKETWDETVDRVVTGNLALVDKKYIAPNEEEMLRHAIRSLAAIPAGRHLWATGVPGRQFLNNCHIAAFDAADPLAHTHFMMEMLMQGGGVGCNYGWEYIKDLPKIRKPVHVHIVCDPAHPDFETKYSSDGSILEEGVDLYISKKYSPLWAGANVIEDSREAWVRAQCQLMARFWGLEEPAAIGHTDAYGSTHIVYDISNIRGRGKILKTFGGAAAGPVPLVKVLLSTAWYLNLRLGMVSDLNRASPLWRDLLGIVPVFDGRGPFVMSPIDHMWIDEFIGRCVVAGGIRRSARMSGLPWYDMHIDEFLGCKKTDGHHWTTNISVVIDDTFLQNVQDGDAVCCRILEHTIAGMLENGEPGLWNSSLANKDEPNTVIISNPCGEINDEAWGVCCLGNINLLFAATYPDAMPTLMRLMTRFLIRATFGDITSDRQRQTIERNRRIGVGILGYADWCAMSGVKYSDSHRNSLISRSLRYWATIVDDEAIRYAHHLRIPVPVKRRAVPPTGTINFLPGVCPGIQPVMFKYFKRRVRYSNFEKEILEQKIAEGYAVEADARADSTQIITYYLQDNLLPLAREFGDDVDEWLVEEQGEIDIKDMLAVQAMVQEEWADNSIAFTITLPSERVLDEDGNPIVLPGGAYKVKPKVTPEKLRAVLLKYLPKLKGTTIMVEESRPQMPYERIDKATWEENNGGLGNAEPKCKNDVCDLT